MGIGSGIYLHPGLEGNAPRCGPPTSLRLVGVRGALVGLRLTRRHEVGWATRRRIAPPLADMLGRLRRRSPVCDAGLHFARQAQQVAGRPTVLDQAFNQPARLLWGTAR